MSSDCNTASVLHELVTSYEAKASLNDRLIDQYTLTLDKRTAQHSSPGLIPAINQILMDTDYDAIDPRRSLIALLQKFLSYLTFKEILNYYPENFILENLYQSCGTASIVSLEIINVNIDQASTKEFIRKNGVVPRLLEVYFNPGTSIAVLNQIQIMSERVDDAVDLVRPSSDLFYSARKSKDPVLLARLLDVLLILLPKMPVDPSLYLFSGDEILKYTDDLIFTILIVQFYTKLIGMNFPIEDALKDLLKIFTSGPDVDEMVKLEIADLIAKMSYNNYNSILEASNVFKTYNLLPVFDKDEAYIRLLSRCNPDLIHASTPAIYEDVLAHLALFDARFFPILLNFIKSKPVWIYLQPRLTKDRLSKLPKNLLFHLLLEMARFNYSGEYLFNQLPSILTDELLESDVRNNEIWNLKLQVLEALTNLEAVPGYDYWQGKLKECYNVMRFGQSYKNIQPKVDIIDETA
ncbi:uncharacterized protein LODBEIA_P60850 [Lodderomyces beijingensis]|uniref:DNA mismatch repair protein HSM3 n=1 Tax=Lodderomyces beijingensis TaxID=1775926 RepID=A0ABP0ZUP5_9ASCO